MKRILLAILSITLAAGVHAQQWQNQRMGSVYITANGNKNLQVSIDGTNYNLSTTSSTVSKTNAITGLVAGMHELKISGTGNNTRRVNNVTTQFNLRRNFDMNINVNADGSIELIEKRKGYGASDRSPMSSTNFNRLMQDVRAQRTVESRNAYLSSTFNSPNNYFTTSQVYSLLQQVRSESDRLPLAKASFRSVTDPNNFGTIYNLFSTTNYRYDLEEYVSNYDENSTTNDPNTGATNGTPMSSTSFNELYQSIRGQYSSNTQVNSIAAAFNSSGNYFTSTQASQLIQLINSESSRLYLAKLSYHTVVDPANFSSVSGLLYTQASRDDLNAFINGQGGTIPTTVRTAMSESDYNTLYQTVNSQFLPYARMNYLTTTFNNEAYYFTAAQAKNLIQMVTNESNRVQLSKAVYGNLVDRSNYTTFYDLFTLPASRTELNSYVQTYRDQ
ncbi:MAG TPA: DUF4476 domain-containing protein [Ferruginibacter sp.]|nr:DUF4476 domain-containing protein [Ferruginibacter sp.]